MSECIDSGLLRESLLKQARIKNISPYKVTAHKGLFAIMSINNIAVKLLKSL